MTLRYFVVEGKDDEFILKHLLPKSLLQDTKINVASGYGFVGRVSDSVTRHFVDLNDNFNGHC